MAERQRRADVAYTDTEEWLVSDIDTEKSLGWWPLHEVLKVANRRGASLVVVLWLLATGLAVVSGIAVVEFDWSGIPITLGDRTIHVTFYPPLIIGLLVFFWLGPLWAMVTTYVATFVLGTHSGIDWLPNTLFALSDSVLILVVWSGMAILEIPPVIRRRSDWAFFLALALIGCVSSSVGALVWHFTQGLSFSEGLGVWEGWVVGAFLETVFVVVPIVILLGNRPRDWLERTLELAPRPVLGLRAGATLLISAMALFAAISVIVARLLFAALPPPGTSEHATMLVARLPDIGLFSALVLVSTIGTTALFAVVFTRRSERERSAARRDRLTGCRNRRAFESIFAREGNRSARFDRPMSLIFFDLDDFKEINDRYGHLAGDRVLQAVSRRVEREIRNTDYLFRWGGDEFALLLPHTTEEAAQTLAKRILSAVPSRRIRIGDPDHTIQASLSLGVTTADTSTSSQELLRRASAECRAAKEKRRALACAAR